MRKQQFKNVQLTRTKVRNNILKVWNETTEGDRFDWYADALQFAEQLSEKYSVGVSQAVGCVAALSPMVSWDRNKQLASELCQHNDPEQLGCLKANARKAQACLESGGTNEEILSILRGKKVSAFYLNIRYPEKAIALTMDRHAVSIALGYKVTDDLIMTAKQYEFFSECYRWTAAQLDVSPLLLQSATWVVWRKRK